MRQTFKHPDLKVPREEIADFCCRWKIKELFLFGSVLRDDFRPESDIDVLVSFAPGTRPQSDELQEMKQELSKILGRQVDLVRKDLVESSKNYIRRKHILEHAEPLYVA